MSGAPAPVLIDTQTQDRGVQRLLDCVIYHTAMGHLSLRIPDSTEAAIDAMADDEGVSRSEVARELLIDGAKLRTGAPVLIEDGGATVVAGVEQLRHRETYLMLMLLVVLGTVYAMEVLAGTARLVALAASVAIALGTLVAHQKQP